jgi:hypothetical protein
MPEEITARLSEQISGPELSKMWESLRTGDDINTSISAPELDIHARGAEVTLRFPSGAQDRGYGKLKKAFEAAIHRFRPKVTIDWAA